MSSTSLDHKVVLFVQPVVVRVLPMDKVDLSEQDVISHCQNYLDLEK